MYNDTRPDAGPCNRIVAPSPNNYHCTERCVENADKKRVHLGPHIARSMSGTEIVRWVDGGEPLWNPLYRGI